MRSEDEGKLEEMESCGSGGSPSPPTATASPHAMELLDRYWFFHNVLSPPPPLPPPPPSGHPPPEEVTAAQHDDELGSPLPKASKAPEQQPGHRLSRQSSLPPNIGKPPPTEPSTLVKRDKKLHRSYTSLRDAPAIASSSQSSRRQSCGEHCESGDGGERAREARKGCVHEEDWWRGVLLLGARKWRSLTDLEHEELQGFKDLGFVFGTGDQHSPMLLKMIPGLRDRDASGTLHARRPYLSEAWLAQRSAPPALNWHGRKSRKEMQQQLRFWARAVASNVRQEC